MEPTSANEPERLYSMADADMRQQAAEFLGNGRLHRAELAAKDPDLTEQWFAEFAASIEAAEQAGTIEQRRASSKLGTDAQETAMQQARELLQDLFFYVRKAYRTSEADQEVFGTDLYGAASDNVGKMKTLLALAHKAAADPARQPKLLAAGYSPEALAQLGAQAGVLGTAATQAGLTRGDNKVDTAGSIGLHNAVWQRKTVLSEAAKRAFLNEPAKRRLFRLYPADGGGAEE